MAKISVIIPLFNKAPHILRAINSVLGQTEKDFEVIVVDDGSTDGGAKIVKTISDPRIRLIQQVNQGVSLARNRGIAEAGSNFIAFLDADDAWKPIFLKVILKLEKDYPKAGIFATSYECAFMNKIFVPKFLGIPDSSWSGIIPNYFYSVLGNPPVWTSAVMIPKNVLQLMGGFCVGEKMGQDIDLWLRIALKYPVAFNTQVGATYFQDASNSICRSQFVWRCPALKRTIRDAIDKGNISALNKIRLQEYLNKKNIEIVTKLLLNGKKNEAKELLRLIHTKFFLRKKITLILFLFLPGKILNRMLFLKRILRGERQTYQEK